MPLPKYLLIAVAALAALCSLGIWFVFLRPAERKSAHGVIAHKIFKPAGEYIQYPAGLRSGFYAPNRIPIAKCYVLGLHVDGVNGVVGYVLNAVAAEEYQVGQDVTVEYERRGVPPIWNRVYIVGMSR